MATWYVSHTNDLWTSSMACGCIEVYMHLSLGLEAEYSQIHEQNYRTDFMRDVRLGGFGS